MNRIETRPSPEILHELQKIGIGSERSGGVKFIVEIESDMKNVKPRRLPAIVVSNDLPRRNRTEKSMAGSSKGIFLDKQIL